MADKTPSWVLKSTKAPPPPPEPSLLDTLGEYAGVSTRALSPYATAATLGGAAGAPFAGVGVLPGAAGGVLSLGAADLGTGIYNLAAPLFGGERVALPSETIQNAFERIGVGRRPQTAAQQVYSDVLQAASGGASQATTARYLSNVLTSPNARNWMRFLGQNARAQTAAAAGGAGAPSVAANYFGVENPYALTGLSLAGGMAAGRAATPRPNIPTADQLRTQARAAYAAAEQAGVRVAQPELAALNTDIRTRLNNVQFIPGTQPEVRRWLNVLDNEFRGPISFQRLDALHSDIMAQARTIRNDRTRMMLQEVGGALDDFVTNLRPNQVTSGNTQQATSALARARTLWRQRSQSVVLDTAFEAARDAAEQASNAGRSVSFSDALKSEFSKIVRNQPRFSRLTPEVQRAVRDVANGTYTSRAIHALGRLSPVNIKTLVNELALGAGGSVAMSYGAPSYVMAPALIAGAATTTSALAKPIANRMTLAQAQRARATAAGVPRPPGYYLMSPTAQQAVQARQKGETATKRRDAGQIPFWAIPKK